MRKSDGLPLIDDFLCLGRLNKGIVGLDGD